MKNKPIILTIRNINDVLYLQSNLPLSTAKNLKFNKFIKIPTLYLGIRSYKYCFRGVMYLRYKLNVEEFEEKPKDTSTTFLSRTTVLKD